jgi:hypothetical protein
MQTITRQRNSKLGKGVMSTYRGKKTCPPDCPMFKACYAKCGPANLAFSKPMQKNEGDKLFAFMQSIPQGKTFRHHVTGDFGRNGKLDYEYIAAFILAHYSRPDVTAWTYTHFWRSFTKNPFQGSNVNVNASCETLQDVKEAREKGFDAVLVTKSKEVPQGAILCRHAQSNGKVQCKDCLMCATKNHPTIALPIHGNLKKYFTPEV